MRRSWPLALLLALTCLSATTCHAGFWPIDSPLPVLDKLIQQGGTFRGRSVANPEEVCEFRISRTDETATPLPYYVYKFAIVIKRQDGTLRKGLQAELYTVRDLDWSDREITMAIRHPAQTPLTRWRLSLDSEGRLIGVWARRFHLGGLGGKELEGDFRTPLPERFNELHHDQR